MSHHQGPPASRRPIPFAGAGDVVRAHTPATYPTHGGVDPDELDGQVEETYDRDVVTAEPRPAPRDAGPLAEAPGYPPLCAHGMNSFVDRGYDLALARLTVEQQPPIHVKSKRKEPPVSPYLYRRLMREKLARLRQHAGAPLRRTQERSQGVAARAQPSPGRTTALRAVERNAVVTTPTTYRQLDQRTADGLVVSLEWTSATEALRIVVVDRESQVVTFPVSAADASDAFAHPFIYAGRVVCEVA